ncbi:MAG TPA: phytoene desaturase [Burkholderiaceae bacterium]|nr:phytoene desaturase [Burkholderiaceae bacterium]
MNFRITTRAPRAAVIGAGFGGLALALRLQSAGIAVTLIEKRDRPGGRAYVYEDAGFTFDAGPTVITDPASLAELFELAGTRIEEHVELMPVAPFYRLMWSDGSVFDYANDQDALDAQIGARNPRDVQGYRRFLAYSRAVYDAGYKRLGAVPFLSFRDMVRAAPDLARLESWKSVYGIVSRFIEDERLREAFSFHALLVGGNPFRTSAIYALIHALEREGGVWFPRGGTGALVEALVKVFRQRGGVVKLGAEVERIEIEGDRARAVSTVDGWRGEFDMVASNADVVHTYAKLMGDSPRGRAEGRRLGGARHSMSLFVVYFGLKRLHPQLRHHTVLFGPRYEGLIGDVFGGASTLPDDFSLYLHAPTVTDPSLAPPGCTGCYVLSPVPHLGHAPIDWEVEGPRYRDRILEHLERTLIPGLREDLVTSRWFGPTHFRDELNAHHGSAFSIEPILTQSAWFRPHNRDDRIGNLYLVGAGTHPGAGIPGVVGSAKATAMLMLADAGIVA